MYSCGPFEATATIHLLASSSATSDPYFLTFSKQKKSEFLGIFLVSSKNSITFAVFLEKITKFFCMEKLN